MRVLFISNDPSIFDASSAARSRMRSYAAHMEELHIISPAPLGTQGGQEGNVFLYPVQGMRLFRVGVLAHKSRILIRERNIEVVSTQDPFELGLAGLRAARGTNAKLHIQVHTDFLSPWFIRGGNWRSPTVRMPFLNRYRRYLADKVLPQAVGIRVVSERVKRTLLEHYGTRIKEPTVIPVSVDPTVPSRVPLPPHTFTFALITVGRLESEKRIEDIFAALKLVLGHYPMVGLFVVGGGRERGWLEQLAQSIGVGDKVIFLGERSDARALIGSAQAYIQASAYEGYSRTLVEAALAKVPIITTDVGIVGEVFKGYEDVLSVPVADPTALSLAIVGLIEDTAVRHELPIRAETAVRAHLTAAGDISSRVVDDLSRI